MRILLCLKMQMSFRSNVAGGPVARVTLLQKLSQQLALQGTRTREGLAPLPYLTPSGTSAGSG